MGAIATKSKKNLVEVKNIAYLSKYNKSYL